MSGIIATPTHITAARALRSLLEEFHAERVDGRLVMVARLDPPEFTHRMNQLAELERSEQDALSL